MSDHLNEQTAAIQRCEALLNSCQSLQMATLDAGGFPFVSYAPYIKVEGILYIFVSRLAAHTEYLLSNEAVSLMVIRDESISKNIFARERVMLKASIGVVEGVDEKLLLLDEMQSRLGKTMALLRGLSDFVLISLQPISARYVEGFGKTFDIDYLSCQVLSYQPK